MADIVVLPVIRIEHPGIDLVRQVVPREAGQSLPGVVLLPVVRRPDSTRKQPDEGGPHDRSHGRF